MKLDLRLSALLLSCALLATGCGTLHRQAQFTSTGSADPRADTQVKTRFEEARDKPLSATAEEVTVLIDTLPEGVTLNGGVLTIDAGYEHRIIGKFEMTPGDGFFPPFREGWRHGYCHPQQILLVGTLFIWAAVPLYYPCFATPKLSKADLVDQLKILGQQAGGDLVIATYLGEDQESASKSVGFVLKKDPRLAGGGGPVPSEDSSDEAEPDEAPEGATESAP